MTDRADLRRDIEKMVEYWHRKMHVGKGSLTPLGQTGGYTENGYWADCNIHMLDDLILLTFMCLVLV
jgi:hypothetical protein